MTLRGFSKGPVDESTSLVADDVEDNFVHKYSVTPLDLEAPKLEANSEVLTPKVKPKTTWSKVEDFLLLVFKELFLSGNMKKSKAYFCSLKDSNFKPATLICLSIDMILRGISQVYICDNPFSGLLIAIAVGLSSVELLFHCVLGVVASTASGFLLCRLPYDKVSGGLLGYDGALVGCTVWTFMTDGKTTNDTTAGRYLMVVTVLLAAFSGMMHMTCANVLTLAKLPPFTIAFNICCFGLLVVCARDNINSASLQAAAPAEVPNEYNTMSLMYILEATLRGVGQFIYADTTLGGALVVFAVFSQGRRDACCLVLGSFIGCLSARYLLQVPQSDVSAIRLGLYGYNSAGVCVVLGGGRFYRATKGAIFLGCVGAAISVFVQVVLKSCFVVNEIQLPVMTFPFVLTSWIMMYTESGWIKVKVDNNRDDEKENIAPTRQPKKRAGQLSLAGMIRQKSADIKRMVSKGSTSSLIPSSPAHQSV